MSKRTNSISEKGLATLFKNGKSVHAPGLFLRFLPNRMGRNRLVFVVSTKISKKAVIRNKIRRRMREIVMKLEKGGDVHQGYDIAILAKDSTKTMTFVDLQTQIQLLFRRAWLL